MRTFNPKLMEMLFMAKAVSRKFVAVDPAKCTGCSLCEYVCVLEKNEPLWNPLRSRIRVIRLTPAFNLALTCRFCENAPCVRACPRNALTQSEEGFILVDEAKCDRCGWCIQACPYGGISLHPDKASVLVCDLCKDKPEGPQCVEFCPEEALETVTGDDVVTKKWVAAMEKVPANIEKLTNLVKKREWAILFEEAEDRAKRLSEKLEAINKKWGYKLKQL
jgi:Fe-S-cluster-containing hydrogenase component 2